MILRRLNRPYTLTDLYEVIKDDMNNELRDAGFCEIGLRTFKQVIKHYYKSIMNRVIYRYETVELYNSFGTMTGHKILCTRFNPFAIDINKTDGYFYFTFWLRPRKYTKWSFKMAPIWKKRIFQNVRDNGGDYPELNEMTYDFSK